MPNWFTSALAVYAEPLIVGRRVLVIAQAAEGAPERLVALGARSVHVFEPRPSGDQLASRVVIQPLPATDFDVRDGAFDLAIVPDVDQLPDAPVWLARLRRVLGAEGALLVATREVDQEAYYRLYDAVALQFANVVMHAEVPFSGFAIAELGRVEEVEVTVDTQLMDEPRAPVGFVALASQSAVHLAPYAIVEAPASVDNSSSQAMPSEQPIALAEARLQVDLQATQLEEERAARQHVEHELHRTNDLLAAEKSARAAAERAAESVEDTLVLRERCTVLETSLQIAEESIEVLSARLARAEESLQKKAEETLVLLAELDAVHSIPPPPPQAEDPRLPELEAALAHLQEVHASEVHALEEQLRERAATISMLQHEARVRERVARELVAQLEEADTTALRPVHDESARIIDELRKKLDASAMEAARRQSELEARAWRIAELETRLQSPKEPSAAAPSAIESELDALRQALTQEHAARVAAESGEALLEARRELERQSALLHQLQQQRR